jgi:subtilisin family serine protease
VHGVEAIAVAATTNSNGHALYSTIATYVDISAPGGAGGNNNPVTAVLSTWNDGQFRAISGTSMATPHVAAAAALVWSCDPSWTATQIRDALAATAKDAGAPGRDTSYGFGIVQARDALVSLGLGSCRVRP